jgi:hypothetical protein
LQRRARRKKCNFGKMVTEAIGAGVGVRAGGEIVAGHHLTIPGLETPPKPLILPSIAQKITRMCIMLTIFIAIAATVSEITVVEVKDVFLLCTETPLAS